MTDISEAERMEMGRTGRTMQFTVPMPWFALRDMSADDLRAIYRFVRYPGPAAARARVVPPDQTPSPPYIQFPAQ